MLTIAYHGCPKALALDVVMRKQSLKAHNKSYHWLGDGIYFWENDPHRALEWAQEKASREPTFVEPFVIGAVINLGRCLDLHVRKNEKLLRLAYESLAAYHQTAGEPLPVNKPAPQDQRPDNVLRYLDCAVINHMAGSAKPPFDTVRGMFVEGEPVYVGAEIYEKTHLEIAVRNIDCIKGYFLPDQDVISQDL